MKYYFDKTLNTDFETAVSKTVKALKKEGFGVLSEVAAVDPTASMLSIQNKDLQAIATEIRTRLKKVIDHL